MTFLDVYVTPKIMGTSINVILRIQGLMKKLTLLELQLWACFFLDLVFMVIEDLLYNFDNMFREENIFLELLILVEFQSYVQEV